ncbi:MAG TPA: hypothetical protein VIF14_01380 [Alphaproteobacteria bacterium]|jgi:hypothetical protein
MRDDGDGHGTEECRSAVVEYAVIAVFVALAGAMAAHAAGLSFAEAVAALKWVVTGGGR